MFDFLPQWIPLWLQLLLVVVGVVYGLLLLMVPFAVFGVKGRLREIELQQQELQADLQVVSMHLASLRGQGEFRVSGQTSSAGLKEEKFLPDVVVEEIRFPGSSSPEISEDSVIMPSVRAPRVSDAYEPRYRVPPLPQEDSVVRKRSARIMPWHTQGPSADRPDFAGERAPDANKPPRKPDFNQEYEKDSRGHSVRFEPVLNWPPSDSQS